MSVTLPTDSPITTLYAKSAGYWPLGNIEGLLPRGT